MSRSIEFGGIAVNRDAANPGLDQTNTGNRIAKRKGVDASVFVGLSGVKVEGNFITQVVEGAATVDNNGRDDSRIIEFIARDRDTVADSSPRDENHAVGQDI